MALPYERQIVKLLRELTWHRMIAAYSRQDRAQYTKELQDTCREIERALRTLEEKQHSVFVQWKELGTQDKNRLLLPVMQGAEEMTALAAEKGWEAIGEYLEACIMEDVLDLLDM
jgi:hypothetical protein